jgi:hypothetical protein
MPESRQRKFMSVKVMAWVWDLDLQKELKFILLAYADHADHDGKNIYPAVATIAKKTGYSERAIQYNTKKLVTMGLLIETGKSDLQTNKYHMPIYGGATIAPPTHTGGANHDTKGVQTTTQGVQTTT